MAAASQAPMASCDGRIERAERASGGCWFAPQNPLNPENRGSQVQKWIRQPQSRGDTMSVHVSDWDGYLVPGTRQVPTGARAEPGQSGCATKGPLSVWKGFSLMNNKT